MGVVSIPLVVCHFAYESSAHPSMPTSFRKDSWFGPTLRAGSVSVKTEISGTFDPADMPALIAQHTHGLTINRWPTKDFLGRESIFSNWWVRLVVVLGGLLLLGVAGMFWVRAGRDDEPQSRKS